MYIKSDIDNINYINIRELSMEAIKKVAFDGAYKYNTDIYIVNDDQQLVGLVSEKELNNIFATNELLEHINYNPIRIVSSRIEEYEIDAIFRKFPNIKSIPVVDGMGKLLYFYERMFCANEQFLKLDYDNNRVEEYLKNLVLCLDTRCGREMQEAKYKIITDIKECENYDIIKTCDFEFIYDLSDIDPKTDTVVLAFFYDFNAINTVEELIRRKIKYVTIDYTGTKGDLMITRYFMTNPFALSVLREEVKVNSPYFDFGDFENIFQAIEMTKDKTGDYVEIGTFHGDSARAALLYMQKANIKRRAWFIDTYEGFNYVEASESCDSYWEGTHCDTSLEMVKRRLNDFENYELVKNNIISDQFPEVIGDIVVCNIDVDMYEAVEAALHKVKDKIVKGGIMIAEDYGHLPALVGAHYAVENFYKLNRDMFYGIYMQSGQFLMIRK